MMTEQEFQSMTLAQHNQLPNRERADRFARMSAEQRSRLLKTAAAGKPATGAWDAVIAKHSAGQMAKGQS